MRHRIPAAAKLLLCTSALLVVSPSARSQTSVRKLACREAVLEGRVSAGESFERPFADGLRFHLEPLVSGWIVRVLGATTHRESHDFAELATPPYQSVNPLLISTDWSFRAQDAVAWNPRHFRYAATYEAFRSLASLLPGALAGQQHAESGIAMLAAEQPMGTFEILDARFSPGLADQAKMASVVALHLAATPHEVDASAAPSPLGKLEQIRFRVRFELRKGAHVAKGVEERGVACTNQPVILGAHHTR